MGSCCASGGFKFPEVHKWLAKQHDTFTISESFCRKVAMHAGRHEGIASRPGPMGGQASGVARIPSRRACELLGARTHQPLFRNPQVRDGSVAKLRWALRAK